MAEQKKAEVASTFVESIADLVAEAVLRVEHIRPPGFKKSVYLRELTGGEAKVFEKMSGEASLFDADVLAPIIAASMCQADGTPIAKGKDELAQLVEVLKKKPWRDMQILFNKVLDVNAASSLGADELKKT
jgi:hypothetical protein